MRRCERSPVTQTTILLFSLVDEEGITRHSTLNVTIMPTPTPTFIKGKHKPTPYPHSSKPWVTEYGHGSKASKKPFVEKAPPAPLEAHEPVHPFRDINRPDGNYGPPGSACDRRLLSRLRKRSTLICPPNACPPFEEALPMRLPEATTDASLVLNPHYDGPGMPRFAVVFYPKVYGKEKVMDFYRRSRDLTFVGCGCSTSLTSGRHGAYPRLIPPRPPRTIHLRIHPDIER